jgi:hypothetical protein
VSYNIDLTATLAALKAEIKTEVLAELGVNRDSDTWPGWMNATTASRYLDVSVERIYKLVQRGQFPVSQAGPGHRLSFERKRLDAWMNESGTEPSTAP